MASALLCSCVSERVSVGAKPAKESQPVQPKLAVEPVSGDAPELPVAPPPALSANNQADLDIGEITIQPDCLLRIHIEEDPQLDGNYPVNELGAIQLGYVGPVFLYNKTEAQAEDKVREVLRHRDFRKATVKVQILRASYDKVQVSGKVNRPSVIRIGAGDTITLNEALLRTGGIHPSARNPKAVILRGGLLAAMPFAIPPEEHSLMDDKGRPSIPNVRLRNNDILEVRSETPPVAAPSGDTATIEVMVLGEVSRPGIIRFLPGEKCTMLNLIFKLGGNLPLYANKKAVKIIRRDEDGSDKEIKVNVAKLLEEGNPADDVELRNGDRVKVPARRIALF